MPERRHLLLLLLLACSPAAAAAALLVEGVTLSGMDFSGVLAGASGSVLMLDQPGQPNAQQLGIPLEAVRRIRPAGDWGEGAALLDRMETALPLLALWDAATLERIRAGVEAVAEAGDWPRVYHWSGRLAGLPSPAPQRGRIRLLQAWSLFEMGLPRQAEEALADLLETTDPLEASPRLCWLAGTLALRAGRPGEARFWALLPALRIPAARGALAADLQALLRETGAPAP